jgi:hypothetical protein
MKTKNPYGKTVKRENAYAVYQDKINGWTWYVLKMYQGLEAAKKNPYARAFCCVTSPIVGERGELGDTYLNDIGGQLIAGVDVRGNRAAMKNLTRL